MQKINNLIVLTTLILLSSCDSEKPQKAEAVIKSIFQPSIEQITLNNQGVGEMGSFDYDKATITFEKLLDNSPDWELGLQNYAIALLNRQKEGDEDKAMMIAKKLSSQEPSNLVAHYIVGILNFNQGLCEQALPRFESIIKADVSDAYALYFAGQCYLQNGEVEQSLGLYQRAIKADDYLRSAYYGSFMAAQRLENSQLAKEMLVAYKKLGNNPKARLAEIKYTRMGPKANAQAYSSDKTAQKASPDKLPAPYFSSAIPIAIDNVQQFGVVNLEQTENSQLYIIFDNQLKLYDEFIELPKALEKFSLALNKGSHQLAWGDINNDSKIDVYSTGLPDQLYFQSENGLDAVDMQAFGLNQLSSKAARLIDADHDGDLDLLLLSDSGKFEIWNNNLNNTFVALSKKTWLPTEEGFKQIFVQDFDGDRDADIILIADNKFTLLLNDRMWNYEAVHSLNFPAVIQSASFSDNDSNGLSELNLLFKDNKIISFEYDGLLKYYKTTQQIDNIKADGMLQADINGDSSKEYLLRSSDGIKIIDADAKVLEQIVLNNIQSYKLFNSIKGPELLVLQNNQLRYIAANNNRAPYLYFNLSGKEDTANSVRSNFSGIGSSFIIRNQDFYAIGDSFQNMTGLGQDYQGLSLAAGNQGKIDYIEMEWSDGVYQTELGLETNKYHRITETQRQLSSCPVIFAWNKGEYEFVSDVLGVGGIGFAIGHQEYGVPRPWENYLLTSKQFSPQDGVFKLQFTEPMEESAYLDELTIQVVDVAKQYSVILDERMMIGQPQVTGKALFYKTIIRPDKVLNNANQEVTQAILKTDKVAIEIDNNDYRFLGLVDEQIITMQFDQELEGDYQFIMNGWVEYGYSQTMFAAWQAGLIAHAPTLEYKIDGQWKVLLSEFGYPAGMPRAASVGISIPEKTTSLRIRTNMEVYFDELALVKPLKPESINKYTLKLKSAQLRQLGFPKRKDNKQRVPSYDYSDIKPFWDTRYMEGAYTQLGDVSELLIKQDNALAIIGAGESIELIYQDDLPQLANGFERYYILQFKGWAKDMDILTKGGETLAPIPANGRVNAKAKQLNKKYNTRFKAGK